MRSPKQMSVVRVDRDSLAVKRVVDHLSFCKKRPPYYPITARLPFAAGDGFGSKLPIQWPSRLGRSSANSVLGHGATIVHWRYSQQ